MRGSIRHFVPEKVAHPRLRFKSTSSRQVEAEQLLFPSQIKLLPGKHRSGPAGMMEGWNLPPANLFVLPGIEPKQAEQTAFTEGDQFAVGQEDRAAAVNRRLLRAVRRPAFVTVPHQFPALPFNAPETCVRLVPATESVKITLVQNRRGPMDFQHCAAPDFLHAAPIGPDAQEDGTDFVIRAGNKDQII